MRSEVSTLPTLSELCRKLGADLEPIWPPSPPDVPVSAVHVSELLDPTPYLAGGELLLTTGLSMEPSIRWLSQYVSRLEHAGTAALGFGPGPVLKEPPSHLAAACEASGLPLLVVPVPTPFQLILRTYWTMRTDTARHELNNLVSAHRRLISAAVSRHPAHAILRSLAHAVNGWAAELTYDGSVLVTYPTNSIPLARATGSVILKHNNAGTRPSLHVRDNGRDVVLEPLGNRDRPRGYLAIGSTQSIPSVAQQLTMSAAALLGLESKHDHDLRNSQHAVPSAILTMLRDRETYAARRLAHSAGIPLPHEGVVLAVILGPPTALALFLDEADNATFPDTEPLVGTVGKALWILAQPRSHDYIRELRRLIRLIPSCRAALGPPVAIDEIAITATRLHRAAEKAPPGTLAESTSAHTDLDTVMDSLDLFAWAEQRLVTLLDPANTELLATLTAYLHLRGDKELTAQHLGVHRHTVRNRIQRTAHLLGADIDDPDIAMELLLALRIRARHQT